MSDELKPCPFCGSQETSIEVEIAELGRIARVQCEICGATQSGIGVMVGPDDDVTLAESAIAAWNRRAAPLPDNAGLSRIAARQITAAVMQVIANAPEGEIPEAVEIALPALLMRLVPEACTPDNVREAVHTLGRDLDVTIEEEREIVVVDQQALCTVIAHLTTAPTTGQRKEDDV